MKYAITLLLLLTIGTLAFSQENRISLSYGYPIANIEEVDESGAGWRLNLLYEFTPMGTKVSHGLSFGYIGFGADITEGLYTGSVDVNAWPIYYAPKFCFGSDKFKGFIKGALGWQFSKIKYSGNVIGVEDNDSGFAGGAGVGGMYFIKENLFLDLEYEFLWLSNSFYRDEALHTVSIGLGIQF